MTARRRASARPAAPAQARGLPAQGRGLLDSRELKRLTVLMEESGLVELEIESGGEKVRLVRGRVVETAPVVAASPPATRAARREAEQDGGAGRNRRSGR